MRLQQAVEGYLLWHQIQGHSERTVQAYAFRLRVFARWLAAQGLEDPGLRIITISHLTSYQLHLQDPARVAFSERCITRPHCRRLSPDTVHDYMVSLYAFLRRAHREKLIPSDITEGLRPSKIPKRVMPTFTKEEMVALLKACDDHRHKALAVRNKAIVLSLLDTDIRASELCRLQMADLDVKAGRAKIQGKGAKERYVYLVRVAKRAVWRYVSLHRPEPLGIGNDSGQIRKFYRRRKSLASVLPERLRDDVLVRLETMKALAGSLLCSTFLTTASWASISPNVPPTRQAAPSAETGRTSSCSSPRGSRSTTWIQCRAG